MFDWNSFMTGKISVTFKTKNDEQKFLKECDKRGIRWTTGNIASDLSYWKNDQIAYRYSYGSLGYGGFEWYNKKGHAIIIYGEYNKNTTLEEYVKQRKC